MSTSSKRTPYEQITARIVELLDAGVNSWTRPWHLLPPVSAASGRPYSGVNRLSLMLTALEHGYESNGWVTYKAALDNGGQVRRGERGTPVVWFEKRPKTGPEASESEREDANVGQPTEFRYFARVFHVFSLDQVDGAEGLRAKRSKAGPPIAPHVEAERIAEQSGAVIRYSGDSAYYNRVADAITLPPRDRFISADAHASTLLHELAHWTGHASRLNREFGSVFGDPRYAAEELVAELASAFLASHCGFAHESQAAAYLQSWLAAIKADSRAIFTAARMAQQAADYLTGNNHTGAVGQRDHSLTTPGAAL